MMSIRMVQCHAARVVIACLTRVEDLARGFMPRSSITCVQFTRVSTFLFFRQSGRAVHAGFVYSFTSHVLMGIFQCINGFRLYDGPAPYTIDLTFVTCLQDGNFMQSSAEVTIKMSPSLLDVSTHHVRVRIRSYCRALSERPLYDRHQLETLDNLNRLAAAALLIMSSKESVLQVTVKTTI